MEFMLGSFTNRQGKTEYSIRLLHKNRVIFSGLICQMLNITPKEWDKILIKQGAIIERNEDIDGLVYKRIVFTSLESVQKAINYLNEKYTPMLSMLYNTTNFN